MNYFKKDGIVYAYDDGQVAQGYGSDMIPLTSAELAEHLNPPPTPSEIVEAERQWRNEELVKADIALNKILDTEPTALFKIDMWRDYRQALRNWPEHPNFPDQAHRPQPPVITPTTVPTRVSMRQAKRALHAADLLNTVESAIAALPEPPRIDATLEWTSSNEMYRNKDFVLQLTQLMGLTEAQVDALFIEAAKL